MTAQKTTPTKEDAMPEHGYRVIYEQLAEGGYQVIVPALPGIVTYGRTLQEAREMARDAIVCHLRGLIKDGEEIPEDPFVHEHPVTEELKVSV
jgi:antitoxin HicB